MLFNTVLCKQTSGANTDKETVSFQESLLWREKLSECALFRCNETFKLENIYFDSSRFSLGLRNIDRL